MVLTKKVRDEIEEKYKTGKYPCYRCGDHTGHYTKQCDAPFKKAWKDTSVVQQADRAEAEQLFKDLKAGIQGSGSNTGNSAVQTSAGSAAKSTASTVPGIIVHKYTSQRSPNILAAPKGAKDGVIDENVVPEVQRLGQGPNEANQEVAVVTNYVRVTKIPDTLHVYSLTFKKPNPDPSKATIVYNKRRDIERCYEAMMRADVLNLKSNGKDIQAATDWKDFWTTEEILDPTEQEKDSDPFSFIESNGVTTDKMFVTVKYQGSLTDIRNNMRNSELRDLPDYIRALNAIVAYSVDSRKGTDREITRVGINKFFLNNGFETISSGLRVNRSYYTSIRPGKNGILLNVNAATSAFLPPILVSDFVRGLNEGSKSVKIKYAEKLLRGKQVRIIYERPEHKGKPNEDEARIKTFRHFGFAADKQRFFKLDNNPDKKKREVSSEDAEGTRVSDFFTRTFQQPSSAVTTGGHSSAQASVASILPRMTEEDRRFPGNPEKLLCVNVGNAVRTGEGTPIAEKMMMKEQSKKGAVWIPACFLEIIPNQIVTVPLQGQHSEQMIARAAHWPAQNCRYITQEGFGVLGLPRDTLDFAVENKLIMLAARKLNPPSVLYGTQSVDRVIDASWSLAYGPKRGLIYRKFISPVEDNITTDLLFMGQQESPIQHKFQPAFQGHGLNVTFIKKDTEKGQLDIKALDKWLKPSPSSSKLSIIVLEAKDMDKYSTIKRKADIKYGRHTLCVVGWKAEKSASLPSNLALKVNMKFGGRNHHLGEIGTLLKSPGSVIVLGADVTHPGAGAKPGSPSIACVVGSIDSHFMNYPGSMRLQAGGQERIEKDHLKSMVKERLKAWKSKNTGRPLPSRILFYRDGISESQFQECKDLEITTVKEAFKEISGKEPELTFVICGKRHHTRFYATDKNNSTSYSESRSTGISGNPKPGLLVQNIVTNPKPPNFFLQSHCAIKGTARPAHYHVLEDGMDLYKGEKGPLPEITNLLCYAFGRATKGVSYVAPAYIADRLCDRGRAYLRAWNNDSAAGPAYVQLKDGDKVVRDKERVRRHNDQYARTLMRTPEVWGPNYSEVPEGEAWLNPWHKNLDGVMFWL